MSFGGESKWRREDARQYRYVSPGGGEFYITTLRSPAEDERVWVNFPGTGYVGVGRVLEPAKPIAEFDVVERPQGTFQLAQAKPGVSGGHVR